MIKGKEYIMDEGVVWPSETRNFRAAVAACTNDEAMVSPSQQHSIEVIVDECKEKDLLSWLDAMKVAAWLNTCRWR